MVLDGSLTILFQIKSQRERVSKASIDKRGFRGTYMKVQIYESTTEIHFEI